MKSVFSPLWIGAILAIAAAFPLACSEEKDPGCKENCGGSGGDAPFQCQSNQDCEPGLACIEGTCTNCSGDGDCLREEVCDPVTLTCGFRNGWGNECFAHEECALGRYCSQGLCLPTEMVTQCGQRGQCPEGMRCNRKMGAPSICEEDLGCFENADCTDDEVCNIGTARCEIACTPENQADICSPRQSCVEGRCLECTSDDDCSTGLTCNVEAGLCVGRDSCFTNRDCEAGLVCNRRNKLCTEPPPPCSSDNDCLSDERCDLQTGKCLVRACVPDLDDPNEIQEKAVLLEEKDRKNLVVCEGTEKWYKINLFEGDRISIAIQAELLTIHGFDAQFRTEDGQVLHASNHRILTTVNRAGTYYLRVRSRAGHVRYELDVRISKGVPCKNDEFEPNETYGDAAALSAGAVSGLVVCPSEEDWYVVAVPPGKGIAATMAQDGNGNLELELYDGDATKLLASDSSVKNEKSVAANQVTGGRAYLRVRASDARTESVYGLQISLP